MVRFMVIGLILFGALGLAYALLSNSVAKPMPAVQVQVKPADGRMPASTDYTVEQRWGYRSVTFTEVDKKLHHVMVEVQSRGQINLYPEYVLTQGTPGKFPIEVFEWRIWVMRFVDVRNQASTQPS